MGKPTTRDLAAAAGVSLATIDRVLNARAGVRKKTIERVNRAISDINFVRDMSAANLAKSKEYQLVFILPKQSDQFIDLVRSAIDEANTSLLQERTKISIVQVAANEPHSIANEMDKLDADEIDGVAIMAAETPQVRDAIYRLDARGIAVVAFVSHQPNADCAYFVGINNEAAGKTVGRLMARFTGERSGAILVMTETMHSRNSQERRLGFDQILSEYAPRLQILPSMETYGDPSRAAHILASVQKAERNVVGIYLMNHDIVETMSAIKAQGVAPDVVIIGHELTPHTRGRLVDGSMDAVITQDVGHLVRSSVRILRAKADRAFILASQERIRIEITIRENMLETKEA